jgi:hypothetical protein
LAAQQAGFTRVIVRYGRPKKRNWSKDRGLFGIASITQLIAK